MSGLFGAIRRFFRFLFVSALVLVLLGSALGVGAVVYRKPVLEFVVIQTLSFYGFPEAQLTVDEVSAQRTRLNDIVLAPARSSVRSITLTYQPQEIWRGRLQSLTVDGVRHQLNATDVGQGSASSSFIDWLENKTFQSGAVLIMSDGVFTLRNTPIGDIVLGTEGHADFTKTPATFNLNLSGRSVDETSPLKQFSFSGGGMATPNSLDISGPTKVSFADNNHGDWVIDRLDYDDVAVLRVRDKTASFTLDAPVSLAIRQSDRDVDAAPRQTRDVPLAFDLETGTAEVRVDWATGFSGAAELRGASIEIDTWKLKGEDIVLSVPFEGDVVSDKSTLSARISDTSRSPRFTDQDLTAFFRRNLDTFELDANLLTVGQNAEVSLKGRYELVGGEGVIDIGPDTLTFSPDGLQPGDISPLLSAFENTRGQVTVSGQISLTPTEPLRSRANINVSDVDTSLAALSFDGISGDLKILDIFNVRSPPGQVFRAKQMTAPVPLENPTAVLHWVRSESDPLILIESANGQFADGTIRITNTPFRVRAASNDFRLLFDSLSLETLLEDWAAGRVSGSGTISGIIPFTLGPDGPIIFDGKLEAEDDGFIKVHWGEARESLISQGSEFALMVQALDNFQYRILSVGVKRPSNHELSLLIQLEGANPDVLDGYPFRFNINLMGDLEKILAAIAKGQSLTQDLLRGRLNDVN